MNVYCTYTVRWFSHISYMQTIERMSKIFLVAVVGNIGAIIVGQFIGWTSPTLPKLSDGNHEFLRLNIFEASWVASILIVGAIVGCIVCTFTVNAIGRKSSLIATNVPTITGWLIIAFATSPWELYIARFICGLSMGIIGVALPIYLGEISPANIRGILGSLYTVIMNCGILSAYSIGPFLSVRNFSLICIVMPVVYIVTFIWLPESPYYLMRRGDREKAVKALTQLRGNEAVDREADIIEEAVKIDLANDTGFREILFVPGNRRALLIMISLVTLSQFCGAQAFIQYAETIFDLAKTNLKGKYLTIILGCVEMIFSVVCMILADYCGRRMLLMISSIGMACSAAMTGTCLYLQQIYANTADIEWLPAAGTILYIVMYSIGWGTLPFTMLGELFSTNVKALGSTIVMITCGFMSFIVVKWYLIVVEIIGIHGTFWFFTACSVIAVVFTFVYVPETKGKRLERIQEEMNVLKQKKHLNSCEKNHVLKPLTAKSIQDDA